MIYNCKAMLQFAVYLYDCYDVSYRVALLKGGRLSTVDRLVLTSLEQLIFILEILFTCFIKQAILIRWSTVMSLPLQ
jgi:hypothetical protein